MIPDRLQYFANDFWNDQKCDQIWTLGPCIHHQNTSTNTRKVWEHPWNIICHIWESEILKILEGICTFFRDWGIREFENLEHLKMAFGKLKFGNGKFEILKTKSWSFVCVIPNSLHSNAGCRFGMLFYTDASRRSPTKSVIDTIGPRVRFRCALVILGTFSSSCSRGFYGLQFEHRSRISP